VTSCAYKWQNVIYNSRSAHLHVEEEEEKEKQGREEKVTWYGGGGVAIVGRSCIGVWLPERVRWRS